MLQLARQRFLSVTAVAVRARAIDPKGGIRGRNITTQDYSKMVKRGKDKAMSAPRTKDDFWKP